MTERHSRAFQKFREWSSPYNKVVCLSSDKISVAFYLESLNLGGSPCSSLESACYGINWVHNLYGFQSPCDSKLVKNVLKAAKRGLAKPVSIKEPVTPAIILDIGNRFAGPNANLSDLRLATICVTAYTAFVAYAVAMLVFGILLSRFMFTKVKQMFIGMVPTSCWQKTGYVSCPFNLLHRNVSAANLDLLSSLPFFRPLYFHKATSTYSLRSMGVSYSRTREIVLQAFAELGYPKNLFGLHS